MWDSMSVDSCDNCNNCTSSRMKKNLRFDDSTEDVFMDKENLPQSPMKSDDVSLYGRTSPLPPLCPGTSPNHCRYLSNRRPLEDFDPNSQDSGYIANYETFGKITSHSSPTRGSTFSFGSSSLCSMDEDFFEDFTDVEPLDKNLPQDLAKLISGPKPQAKKQLRERNFGDSPIRPLFRRALSLQSESSTTPNTSRARCLFTDAKATFKRPEPPNEEFSPTSKKYKKIEDQEMSLEPVVPVFQRAMSATEESIKCALQRSSTEPDLIGDFSRTFSLPLVPGRHQDLKSISAVTLVQLLKGYFNPHVDSFTVIDCRYPYEFEGGHIGGAVNIYTRDQCMELLHERSLVGKDPNKRHVLVFHCEFSSERGPNLCRFLRKEDRHKNEDAYPALHYPEIYVLEGGYKNFYENHKELCVPVAYLPMNHPEHEQDLRTFRQKSKTWNMDVRQRPSGRSSRLRRIL